MFIPFITFKPKTDRISVLNQQSKYVFNVRSLVQKQSVIKTWFTKMFKVTILKNRIVIPYKKHKHIKHVRNRRYKTLIVGLGEGQLLQFGRKRLFSPIVVDGQQVFLEKEEMVQPRVYRIDVLYRKFKLASYNSMYYNNIIN